MLGVWKSLKKVIEIYRRIQEEEIAPSVLCEGGPLPRANRLDPWPTPPPPAVSPSEISLLRGERVTLKSSPEHEDLTPLGERMRAEESSQLSPSLQERFEEFDRQNPHVFILLKDLALSAKANGRTKIGAKSLIERARWHYQFETKHCKNDFKLNNSYTSLYARKLMAEVPALDGFFETRSLRQRRPA